MGRRVNVDHLSDAECEKILQVIQKDFDLRQKEKARLGQLEEKVEQEETKTTILAEKKKFNENCCIRCFQTFGFIFNRRQLCRFCEFYVCKACRTYFSEFRGYACNFCLEQRDLKRQSCEWFYSSVSRKFKRFGSAKVVRTFYKRKSYSDSELDSGYDPSHSSSLTILSPKKFRPSVQGVFDNVHNNNNNNDIESRDNGLGNELPLPSTESLIKPVSRATSLETLLPSSKERKSKFQYDGKKSKEQGDNIKNRKAKDTRDIYKEAFESAKRAEEIKFKTKFDKLINDFHKSLEKSAGARTNFGSTSYGEEMTTFRSRVKDQLKNLSQRLQLAYESFDTPQTEEAVCQKVRQNISKLVEDLFGESLDLTSDEAVSDLSSLSDESGADHNSYEDHIAQAVLSKILDNHRKENGTSLPDVTDGRSFNNKQDQESLHDSLEEDEGEIDDNSSDLTKDFEDLKKFVRETQKRRTPSVRSIDEKVEIDEVIVPSVDYERSEKKEDFEIRYSSLERVQRAEPPLPDFSDLENIDFSTYEVDPDLLSMNLAIIPEETEEDLDKVSKNEEDKTQWRNNWIIKGGAMLSPYDNCGKKIGGDGELFMMVPQPDDEMVPRVGNDDADQLSDFSDKEEEEISDDENSFYAKTSEELARISRKLSNASLHTDSDGETKSRSSADFDNFKRTLYRSDSDTTDTSGPIVDKSKTKLNYSEELIKAKNDDPKFVLPPESVTIQEGEPLKLTCRVAGTGDVDVFWYREGKEVEELEDSEDYEITSDGDKHSITMFNLKKEQAGQYMCIALNEEDKCTQYFIVTVKGNKQELKKPEFLKGLQDVEVQEGQSVKFRCKVKGYPQPRVTWHKDGKHFKNPRNARIEKFGNRDYILTIDYATMDDDAEYSVIARNIAGQAKSTAQVIVEPAKTDEEMKSQATTPSTPPVLSPDSHSSKSHDLQTPINTKYQNGISNLSDKVLATKNDMSYVAEEMLETANEFSYLNHHLDRMNHQLDQLETNFPSSDFTNNNIDIKLGDTSILEAVANHQAMEKSAKSVRMLTSSALNILRTAEEIIQNEQADSDNINDVVTSTPRPSVTEVRYNERNNKNNDTEPFDVMDDIESVTSDVGASICADDISFQSYQTSNTSVTDDVNTNNSTNNHQRPSDLTLDYTVPDYEPSLNINDFSVKTQDLSHSAPDLRLNFGSKDIDRSRYQRDFCVEDKTKEKKHWDVKLESFSPAAEIVNRQDGAGKTEEQIYLAAGKVYSLEDRVRELEAKVKDVDDDVFQDRGMAELEEEVARTAAQVSQREKEVNSIESAVSQLQFNNHLSPRDNSSQHSSPRHSIDSGFSSVRERPQPVHIVGSTAEEEVPESRGEFDADSGIELPSVNRLRAMFTQQKRDDDFGDGNFTRPKDASMVHSITARSQAKNQKKREVNNRVPVQATTKSVAKLQLSSAQQDINANEKPNQVKLKKTVPSDQIQVVNSTASFVPNLTNPPTYTDLEPGHDPILIYPENELHAPSSSEHVIQLQQNKIVPQNPTSVSTTKSVSTKQTGDKKPNHILDVKRAVPKIRSGCISARAAFWEKRIETGDVSNTNVDGQFPEMVEPSED
ncbi:hypothetical protein SNE40_023104 [Patella caerulea]|uniref:Uncharacterized protein n=1 Tax=Patella caerulea TaxID=87958 RepID=A0AAN8GG58_PATCE